MHVQKTETGHSNVVHDIKMDYNGQRLATASSDTTIKIIGLGNNCALQLLATLTGHQGPVWQVAWGHPKFGSILASCSYEGRVIIWKEGNQNEWEEFYVFNEHKSSVNCISWAPHQLGLCLACGSSDGSISVLTGRSDGGWHTNLIDQAHPDGVTSLSWVPATAPEVQNGSVLHEPVHKLASGGCDNAVKVWKPCNGMWKEDCYPEVQMHSDSERDVASAPNLGLPKTAFSSTLDTSDVSPGKGRHNRWQLEEDELLIRAWLDIYKDPNAGSDQKLPPFWNRVAKYFADNRRGGILRTGAMFKKRWHRMSLPVKKFVECYDQAYQQCHSEMDGKDIVTRAHRLYSSQNDGCRFNLVHAWTLLKDEPKWKAYANVLSYEDCSKRVKVSESGACMSSSSPDTLTSRNFDSYKVCDINLMAQSCLPDPVHKLAMGGCDSTMKVCKVYNETCKTDCLPASQMHSNSGGDNVARGPNLGLSKLTIRNPSEGDASPGEGRHNRWHHEEDELLIRAWLYISKDPIAGNDIRMVPLWERVAKHFEENRKGGILFRTWQQLKKRWHRVSKAVKKFAECYDQACRQSQSEMNEEDSLAGAHRLYRFENDDCRFNLEHVWVLLKDEPKWRAYVNLRSFEGCSKRMKVSKNGACTSSSSPDMPKSGDIGSSEVCDINFKVKPSEVMVGSKGEGKSKGALAKELHAIKSAELKKANALEELARTKQMEVDMQIIYKDTSSMNKEQVQFHAQLVQRLKQKYLL